MNDFFNITIKLQALEKEKSKGEKKLQISLLLTKTVLTECFRIVAVSNKNTKLVGVCCGYPQTAMNPVSYKKDGNSRVFFKN